MEFIVKLVKPYFTSPYFSPIKALLSNYIIFINTYIRSKTVFWRINQFIHFWSYTSYEDIILPWSLWYIHYHNHVLLCQNQIPFKYLWALYVEYRYYLSLSGQSIILGSIYERSNCSYNNMYIHLLRSVDHHAMLGTYS